jgi:UDP-N-acetylmuramoylalanine--D-glutamate ligase
LLGDLCLRAGFDPFVGGNIGKPLSGEVFSKSTHRAAVLEVSSYQLEGIQTFHPDVSIILNITPDHLEHHGSMSAYAAAKERIFENQTMSDLAVLNGDDPWCRKMPRRVHSHIVWISTKKALLKGVYFDREAQKIAVRAIPKCAKADLGLPLHLIGVHNIENCCAAVAAALKIGVPLRAVKDSLKHFKGVEHRLENVARIRGAVYINDSKGTNVDSTVKALEAVQAPIWLILGGQDKGAPYGPLKNLIRKKVKGILLIGEAAPKIKKELEGSVSFYPCGTMQNAVRKAWQLAVSRDHVLLSPACASFDQFKNFEDRGDQFKNFVRSLKK